jgi:trehalose 6-phosphate synthase
MAWNRQRLEETARRRMEGAKLVVVANREPYIHARDGEGVKWVFPASGLVTALDPVMRACGGTWVAHGAGDADREMSDAKGRVAVPPDDPRYTLRRVWLSKQEEQGYYYGFSNEALWPQCHIAYTRPKFDSSDWAMYRAVNRKFADAVLEEAGPGPAVVFVQDYHFALLPRMLKEARPDLVVMQFWHIPWPNPEAFRICPWQEEILDGLLGNDILSFHIQYHCNNFLATCDRALESRIDWEHFSVVRGGKSTRVRPQAISIDVPDESPARIEKSLARARKLRRKFGLGELPVLFGVDRIDYTKGIPERLRAIDRLLTLHPEHKGRFKFLQIGAPSRTHIPTYRRLGEEIAEIADQINWRHAESGWEPIALVPEHHGQEDIEAMYRTATACVVSSLHDGMNLVAKEFVAARPDLRGSLVLSRFTGAARELTDALLINPYDADGFAEALHSALIMPEAEQERRMRLMRRQVEDNNIWRWAGMLLSEAGKLLEARTLSEGIAASADDSTAGDYVAGNVVSVEFRSKAPATTAGGSA